MRRFLPIVVLVLAALYAASSLRQPSNPTEFDLVAFSRLPILSNGRIKPLDTVARNSLLMFQGRQSVYAANGRKVTPQEWFADTVFGSTASDGYQIFHVDHPDVLAIFGLGKRDGQGGDSFRFSFAQLSKGIPELDRQYRLAEGIESADRSTFQKSVVQLYGNLATFVGLRHTFVDPAAENFAGELIALDRVVPQGVEAVRAQQEGRPHDEALAKQLIEVAGHFQQMEQYAGFVGLRPIPPDAGSVPAAGGTDGTGWRATHEALKETFMPQRGRVPGVPVIYAILAQTWKSRQPAQFNEVVRTYSAEMAKRFPTEVGKGSVESRFNHAAPFSKGMVLYLAAFLLAAVSWLKWPDALGRAAFWTVVVAFVLSTAGIATRMWLEGRPPVTNLYSSAIFIGWGAVGLCLILEAVFRNSIGSAAAGMIGFSTLIIAHYLSLSGDTLEMMRAVLDSNFWLATHVVVVTIGYASTYLAGFLAIIYVFRGVFTRSLDKATADSIGRMVYGIVCFATLFSLVGTILGGIWADQSWGRFWGWDPKENGALIIVIWNAIILHARWGGLIRQRGLMCLAIVGNIVTSWSWFGVNMLEVGLHSYGFIESTFWWLIGFAASQLAIIAIANLPMERWKSAPALPAGAMREA